MIYKYEPQLNWPVVILDQSNTFSSSISSIDLVQYTRPFLSNNSGCSHSMSKKWGMPDPKKI